MKEACPELLGSWVYSGHEKVDCVHEKRVINSYVAIIETGRKHEVLLDRKNWGFCVRGEVATGGWEQPEARRRARGTENAVSSTHWRFLMHKREWRVGEIKRTRFFEPAENMGGQVAARRKRIKHVPPCPLAQRLCSKSPSGARFVAPGISQKKNIVFYLLVPAT